MAGNVTGKEKIVITKCALCPATYPQVWGFFSAFQMCQPCHDKALDNFWKIWKEEEDARARQD